MNKTKGVTLQHHPQTLGDAMLTAFAFVLFSVGGIGLVWGGLMALVTLGL